MLTGDNGLLTKADKATEEHSHASVREGIILAYNEYQTELQTLAKETQGKENVKLASTEVTKIAELKITKNTSFTEFLQGKGYIDAKGIVNTQELLGSKTKLGNGSGKNDVYIVSLDEENNKYVLTYYYTADKEKALWEVATNEKAVKINVSKTPETEPARMVKLKVTSVEGIGFYIKSEEDAQRFVQQISSMDEEDRRALIKKTEIMYYNQFEKKNFTSFEEVLQYAFDNGWIPEPTEEAFFESSDLEGLLFDGLAILFIDEETGELGEIKIYEIINPDGIVSDTYRAFENGPYTFTVKDFLTGKTYTKTVEVTNVDKSIPRYYVENFDLSSISSAKLRHMTGTKIAALGSMTVAGYNPSGWHIGLKDATNEQFTSFSKAYIIYDGTRIDVTSLIKPGEWFKDARHARR